MLLNKIPVLDNGYVALLDITLADSKYQSVIDSYFGAMPKAELDKFRTAIFVIKAPVFIQLRLAQAGVKILSTHYTELEAYLPSAGEIGASSLELNTAIAKDIEQTTAALLINPAAYRADGCDSFISHIISPVSTYGTFIASADLPTWLSLVKLKTNALPVIAYLNVIKDILKTDWSSLQV